MEKLLVAVIGNRNSGKSTTWNTLFGHEVRTGRHERKLDLGNGQSVSVFLVSGSPEERELYVGEIVNGNPRIVLCSIQYHEDMYKSLAYFLDRGYFPFIHWLNPGYSDPQLVNDHLELMHYMERIDSHFDLRDGQANPEDRMLEIRRFIHEWATDRQLVIS